MAGERGHVTERAGVVLTDAMTPVQRCIAIVEDSRRTHVDWERYLASMPDHFPGVDVIGDARWHAECVQNYDEVLNLLREADRG